MKSERLTTIFLGIIALALWGFLFRLCIATPPAQAQAPSSYPVALAVSSNGIAWVTNGCTISAYRVNKDEDDIQRIGFTTTPVR